MKIWRLKKEAEKRVRTGHPWVFSNELAQSPKEVSAGELIELRNAQDGFVAYGYGHPNSLISFRVLSRHPQAEVNETLILKRLEAAAGLRQLAGLTGFSHRLCFAEADRLPGLIIDRYFLENREGQHPAQVFVVQCSTAGMDRLLPLILEVLEAWIRSESPNLLSILGWDETAIIIANDAKSRAIEGLPIEPKRIHKNVPGFDLARARIRLQPGAPGLEALSLTVDLIGGQKTGFFLDQRSNINRLLEFLRPRIEIEKQPLAVLDLCCYVGQWGSHVAHMADAFGVRTDVTCVDSSAKAVAQAVENVAAHGGIGIAEQRDVMESLGELQERAYDVVVCDPPAFIKKKKDVPTGQMAYLKLNREALKRVKPGGLLVSCSCSGLMTEEDFRAVLARAAAQSGRDVRWVMRGGHSPDHPQAMEFAQGTYLKCWIGTVLD